MKILFIAFSESIMRFLVPEIIANGEQAYVVNTMDGLLKVLKQHSFDYVVIDIDNCNFDASSFMSSLSNIRETKWIFYSYQYESTFIDYFRKFGLKGMLSKNIHPEYLYLKLMKILNSTSKELIISKRKYYRIYVKPSENVEVNIFLPTIIRAVKGKAKQISKIGMQVALKKFDDILLIREGQYLSKVTIRLNGYRLELTGKVIKKDNANSLVLMFDKMDNHTYNNISKYIYKKMEIELREEAPKVKARN